MANPQQDNAVAMLKQRATLVGNIFDAYEALKAMNDQYNKEGVLSLSQQ
jgi:hypothetical protein